MFKIRYNIQNDIYSIVLEIKKYLNRSAMFIGKKDIWYFLFLIMFVLLSMMTLKIGPMRLGQLSIMVVFILIMIHDTLKKQLDLKLIIFLWIFPLFFIFITKLSDYPKIKEMTFIIKYMTIAPASFYVGSRMVTFIGIKRLITLQEKLVIIYGTLAILLSIYPIAYLIHDRGVLTGFQGTFWETAHLGNAVVMAFLLALLLKFDFKIAFKSNWTAALFLAFTFFILLSTRNKTIWIGIIFGFIVVIVHFTYIKYILTGFAYNKKNINRYIQKMKSFNIPLILLLIFIFIVFFYIYNSYLLEDPIITQEILKVKIEEERGLAFQYAIALLKDSNWLGMYGFGFVEYYFESLFVRVIGLGAGNALLFNSYLDVWISVGLIGVLYHFLLLKFSFSSRYLTTMILPVYIFIMSNFNPFAADAYYFLYLGILYSIAREKYLNKHK